MKNKFLIAVFFSIFLLMSPNVQASNFTDNQTVDVNKIWTIKFTDTIELDNLTKQGITVTDSKGLLVNTKVQLGQDSTAVTVTSPQYGYTPGENYILNIGTKVHSTKGKTLNNECKLHFNIKNNDTTALTQLKNCTTSNSYIKLSLPVQEDITWVWFMITKDNVKKDVMFQPENGMLNNKLYLTNGAGTYSVEVWATKGERYASYSIHLGKFTFENKDTRDLSYLLPTEYVQSDNSEIITLANDITKGLTTDMEKTKAIHDWIASNIAYDTEAYFSNKIHSYTSLETLQSKKAVCNGYAYLNAALHRAIGIKAKVVGGIAIWGTQGETWENTEKTTENHAWNEIYVDGKWIIEDTTWDAGYVDFSAQTFTFKLKEQYFNPTLEEFEKDHHKLSEI